MISSEELLRPISEARPCGEDLSYDPALQELDVILKGKEATQFSPEAEEPDWKLLGERCLELWPRSKDLRLATAMALAFLKTDGLPGLAECLAVLHGLLERYWETCYPLLDPSDDNDPTQRVNIIAALAMPLATYGDPMRFLERLQEAPLTNSPRIGRFSLADILRGEAGSEAAEGKSAPSAAQVEAAFRDTSPEWLQATDQALARSLDLAKQIDETLTRRVGTGKAPDLDLLPSQLLDIQKRVHPYSTPLTGEVIMDQPPGPDGPVRVVPPEAITGEVRSRQDVLRMLDKICDYYQRSEPSSPVPLLLQRAKRWAEMKFMEIMDDLTPDSVKEIQRITGEKPKESE